MARLVVASLLLTAGATLTGAAAQRATFVDAFAEFRTAIEGTYGDEGPRIHATLDRMDASLANWDPDRRSAAALAPDLLGPADTPVLPLALYATGFASLARGAYDDAMREFRVAAAADPLVADPAADSSVMRQAAAALRRGAVSEAHAILDGSALLDESAEAHRILGAAYWADARDQESLEHLQTAIRQNPRDERSRIALSRVLSTAARDADAERVLQETLVAIPESVQARWWLGWTYERLNRFPDARRAYERTAEAAVAGHGPIYGAIGRLATQAADFAGALDAFTRAVEADPRDGGLRRALAATLLRHDRAQEAMRELTAALAIDPSDSEAHAGIGQIHLDAGRYDAAMNALRRALELSPTRTQARYALATALARLGRTTEAEREFERVEREQRQALENQRLRISRDVQKEQATVPKGAPQ
jgi:tetratricopeptide (TPR) repeat protein